MPQDDGHTLRTHLKGLRDRTGKEHRLLADTSPPCQPLVWMWYNELRARRQGKALFSWGDIYAWARMTGRRPTREQLDLLTLLEATDLDVLTAKPEAF